MSDPYGQPPQDPYAPQPPTPPTNPYAQTPPMSPPPSPSSSPPATPAYGQPYPPQSASPYGYAATPQQNSMALVSMILSLVGLVSWITAPVGAILGHIALKQIRQTGESGEGMAKAGIIIGWIITGLGVLGCCALVVIPIILTGANANY
jgi:Domain of unknown function (DUF4190)